MPAATHFWMTARSSGEVPSGGIGLFGSCMRASESSTMLDAGALAEAAISWSYVIIGFGAPPDGVGP